MAKKPQAPASASLNQGAQNQAKPQSQQGAPQNYAQQHLAPPVPPQAFPQLRSGVTNKQNESNRRAMGGAIIDPPKPREQFASWPFWTGMGLTIIWFVAVFLATMSVNSSGSIAGLPVTTIALGISGVIAPVAFLWMIIAYLQRASDVKAITEPLRRQLQMVLGTGANAESRVRRFNEALERQLELLRQAGDGSYDVLQNAVQVLQEEERAINNLAERSGKEIQRVAGIVRDNSEVLEDLLHDNRERFNDLSGKIAGHIATLDDRADQAASRLGDMVDRLHLMIDQFKAAADQKLADVANVSEQIGRQEKDTEASAQRMSETLQAARQSAQELGNMLSKNQDILDAAGQRLMARMQEIGTQIEHFASISDSKEAKLAQSGKQLSETMTHEIAALEALTSRLEAQIFAANQGIGSRTDELESRQIRLAEQAGNLMQNLQNTVVLLDTTASEAFQKYSSVRDDVANQSERIARQFRESSSHYDSMAQRLDDVSKNVVERVAVIGSSLSSQVESISSGSERASSASQQASAAVSYSLQQLEVMIERIYEAEKQAKESSSGLIGSIEEKFNSLVSMSDQHVARLNSTHDELEDVGQKLSERAREAEGTWQSLVQSANNQQEALQQQLRAKVDDAVALLNENAQAIEAARDSMYQHVEAGLARSGEMVDMLAKLGTVTDAPFNDAVARVRTCVEQGEDQLNRFTAALQKNAADIAELNTRLATYGDNAGHKAAETLAGLDAVAARMEAIQHGNMQATQDVLLRLNHVAQQVQNRMGDISTTAEEEQKRLGETVRQLSFDINGLIHDSQTADQRIRIAASLLSEQASDVRSKLESQAMGIESALGNLNEQFSAMSQQMRGATEIAQAHIEEISKRYGEITHMSGAGLEDKIRGLDFVVSGAAERLSSLGETIDGRTQQLTSVHNQIHDSTQILDSATQQALDRLSVFTHAVVAAKTTSGDTAQEVYARLSDVHEQFNRQISAVSEGSQTIAHTMRDAVANLVEQSVGLAAASQQAEQRIENLAATTAALQAEAQNVRISIEGEAKAMQARLSEILSQIESASVGMERNAVIAFDRTEGMAKRFDGISQSAFARLNEAATQIEHVADGSIAKVEAVNKSLMDQMASLTFAGEHLAEVDSEIRRSAQESTAYLNRLSSEAGATASFAAEQLRQQITGLKTEAEGLLMRFDALGNGFANQSLGVFDIADNLEQKITRLRDTTIAAYEDATNAGQRILSSTLEFKNEVAEAVSTMSATGEGLQQRGEMAITMVHQMAGRFAEATQNLREQFEAQASRLEDVAGKAQAQLQSFTSEIKGGADQLDGLTSKLAASGVDVNETLEKTNFLVRNVSGQIDRMKTSAQEVSGGLLQSMADMISTFESELKGMTDNAGNTIETLNQKARGISEAMKDEAQNAADSILQTLSDMRSNVEGSLDLVVSKTGEVMATVKDESSKLSATVEGNLDLVVSKTGEVMATVKDESSKLSTAMTQEVEKAFASANQNISAMQLDFRSTIVGMVEVLVTHLRQIQENGSGVMESIRSGAAIGTEQAMQMLADLRAKTEEQVLGMASYVELALQGMRQSSLAMAAELKGDSTQTQRDAVAAFAQMREQVEGEFKNIIARAQESAAQLQANCDLLTKDMRKAVIDAERNAERISEEMRKVVEETQSGSSLMVQDIVAAATQAQEVGASFNTVANSMRSDSAKISAGVSEVAQSLSTTNTLLQRSQSALYDVAQKSSDALNVFNDSIMHQSRNLASLQQSFVQTADHMSAADERMTVLKHGFQNVLAEIMERLNGGLVNLGQQIVNVKQEAESAAHIVTTSGQEVANQNINMTQTAEALATALSQLEAVNRTLSANMRDSAIETEQQARQISALSQQVQQQVSTLENAAQAAAHQSVAVSQALDTPLSRFDTLNERMDKTLNLTVMVGDKITGQLGSITREMERALHDLAEGTQKAGSIIQTTTQTFKQARDEAAEEMLQRLRDITRKNEAAAQASYQPQPVPQVFQQYQQPVQQPAPQPQQQYVPQPIQQPATSYVPNSFGAPQGQPHVPPPAQPAVQQVVQPVQQSYSSQHPMQSFVQPQAVKPAPVVKKQDSDLINSLTQIIQQLEETAGAPAGGVDVKQKKSF
ncbi:MAG: hypothetical protein SFW65_05790 [Alphaproteobacteria bacterium]|nr:hypothetical protein [Alphaproteobacteria bacterium]